MELILQFEMHKTVLLSKQQNRYSMSNLQYSVKYPLPLSWRRNPNLYRSSSNYATHRLIIVGLPTVQRLGSAKHKLRMLLESAWDRCNQATNPRNQAALAKLLAFLE